MSESLSLIWQLCTALELPDFPASSAGLSATSATATTELRAMYGGLQMAIGLLAATGFVWVSAQRPAILALAFLAGGLALSRLLGGWVDASFSSYTTGAVIFETALFLVATRFWMQGLRTE